ncbi:MAG: MGMT family protein [Lachnospiraceae bacterium]|nr:MGMT family protein [Lachnospiraceae bacterium]
MPCHRVLNAKGELADEFVFGGAGVQQSRLEAEGVVVKDGGVADETYSFCTAFLSIRWTPVYQPFRGR